MTLQPRSSGRRIHRTLLARTIVAALGLGMGNVALADTLAVTSCNDSGPGSLRQVIADAGSNDVIDLAPAAANGCSEIVLQSRITVDQSSLGIRGDANKRPYIRQSQQGHEVFHHTGSRVLALLRVRLSGGTNSFRYGGCIRGASNVELIDSLVTNCKVSGNPAQGGGVFAEGNIVLTNSAVTDSQAVGSLVDSLAQGGGVHAKIDVSLDQGSMVAFNRASGTYAYGGGVFAGGKLEVLGGTAIIGANEAVATSGRARGGGIYTKEGLEAIQGGIKINGNEARSSLHYANGGGAHIKGGVDLRHSEIANNEAQFGAGLYQEQSSLSETSIEHSVISGNTAASNGGGIYANGPLAIKESTISSNYSGNNGAAAMVRGNLHIDRSTISGNNAVRVAGIYVNRSSPQQGDLVQIERSTISGNVSQDSQSGVGLRTNINTAIHNSTITDNLNQRNLATGAGISITDDVVLLLSSTIVAGNHYHGTGGTLVMDDIAYSDGHSSGAAFLGDTNFISAMDSSIPIVMNAPLGTGQSPKLGPLQDNGGPTLTHLPDSDSPVRGNGLENDFDFDQRGPGFPFRDAQGMTDLGSVQRLTATLFSDGFES